MIHRLILALLLVVAGMLGLAMWRVEKARSPSIEEIRHVVDTASEKVNIKVENHWRLAVTLKNEWISHGETVGVTTTQREGESEADFVERHDNMVAQRKKLYPPDR